MVFYQRPQVYSQLQNPSDRLLVSVIYECRIAQAYKQNEMQRKKEKKKK